MDFQLTGANIILKAKNHNPTIISKEWLSANNILNERVINFAHLPVASVVETEELNLLVEQETLQLVLKKLTPEYLDKLPEIIHKYIDKLPEIPYTALGFNFIYSLDVEKNSIKNIFLIEDVKLRKIFKDKFDVGGIIKFSFEDFVVTLTIKPEDEQPVTSNFNYHHKFKNKENLIKNLFCYQQARENSENILKELF